VSALVMTRRHRVASVAHPERGVYMRGRVSRSRFAYPLVGMSVPFLYDDL
jgi:hypothetical protein